MNRLHILLPATLLACILSATAALTRGPYLQSSTIGSIVIRWRTSTTENSRVIYGTNSSSLNYTNNDATLTTNHIITLTGLTADTKYFYSVGSSTTTLAGATTNHFFLTHPLPGTTKPLRIWVIGDAGTATANQINVRNAFETFNGTNTLHAWLQLGDNAYNTGLDTEYQSAVFNLYTNELRNSVTWPTLGNHETAQATTYVTSAWWRRVRRADADLESFTTKGTKSTKELQPFLFCAFCGESASLPLGGGGFSARALTWKVSPQKAQKAQKNSSHSYFVLFVLLCFLW